MLGKRQFCNSLFCTILRLASAALAMALLFTLCMIPALSVQAQTYTVLHSFTGGAGGGYPYSGLTIDATGNLYGTTCGPACSSFGSSTGTVFRLSRKGSGWLLTTLYTFHGGSDGAGPAGRVIFGPDGSLYGTTAVGGGYCGGGCGTVFKLTPPALVPPKVFGGWTENVLYSFKGGNDGAYPVLGDLTFDSAGNLYGTT